MDVSDEISPIIPYLYISNWPSSNDSRLLQKYNIQAVLTVEQQSKPQEVLNYMQRNNLDFMQIKIDDFPNVRISQYFDQSYAFLKNHISKGQAVLVHCMAGISRSVTLVLNYIIRNLIEAGAGENMRAEQIASLALETIRQVRPQAKPNPGFMNQLIAQTKQYLKTDDKRGLNHIFPEGNPAMAAAPTSAPASKGCNIFMDASGKKAPVICLTSDDFDAQGNLKNFTGVDGVVFFGAMQWCGHCKSTKPEFAKFASMLNGSNIRAFYVESADNKELMGRISGAGWGYEVRGYPTIVGYAQGKFYSEYGYDPNNKGNFRKAEDFLDFAKGLGKADIKWS